MRTCKWVVALAVLVLMAGIAEAKVYIDVYGQSYKKITIAVPPFVSDERQRPEISDLLGRDLDFSGFFVVAPRSMMDKEFLSEGVDKKSIRFDQWRSLGIELLCKAVVQEKNGNFSLEAYVYDASDGTLLFAKRYRAVPAEWKRIVHRLADDIVLAVTGEKGIMSARVAFVAGDRRHREIYVSDVDGEGTRKLTTYDNLIVSPSISPDGKYMAFTSYKEGRPNFYVVELQSHREVYADRQDGTKIAGAWIDAKRVSFSHTYGRTSTIYSVNVETKERKVLLKRDGILASPTFSPDGTKMVFVSDMFGGPNIFIKDVNNGEAKRLSYFGNYNVAPAFSPKGDLIAFVSKTEGAFEICTMRPDGSYARALSEGGLNDSPAFSPCGRYILYSSLRGGKTRIHMMLHNGENKRELKFTGGDEMQPKFMP